ncbi:MAG: non-canonical purine NTP pyrophosphatase [Actinomycetota bacterium]|nr:non-canonical purine NTP pyrophosphatase [Actinomycetota bacterium]
MRAQLASQNEHKLRELEGALAEWKLSLLETDGFPPEEGQSYEENARAKARFGRRVGDPDAWILGEDSGIEVAALADGPGLESARWARGEHVARLLAALEGAGERAARYVCVLVGIAPDGRELVGRGVLEGSIAQDARGSEGFGFDPVFVPAGETRTVAELGNEWKARNSHRARAAQSLREAIEAATART